MVSNYLEVAELVLNFRKELMKDYLTFFLAVVQHCVNVDVQCDGDATDESLLRFQVCLPAC